MKVLAVVIAFALVALPFAGCGGGGGGGFACVGTCGICTFSEDCCGFPDELCTDASSDFAPRCSPADFFCKLAP